MAKIKLCGLRRSEDILAANALEIECIGFVFAKKSRRYVSLEEAKQLKEMLDPKIMAVGVFVNEKPDRISKLVKEGIIDWIQLHGDEDERYIRRLRRSLAESGVGERSPKIIKAFRVSGEIFKRYDSSEHEMTDPCRAAEQFPHPGDWVELAEKSTADYILIDSSSPGSGERFDWSVLRQIRRDYFLAGGLNPENIRDALETVHPFGVDTSSGIESDEHKDAVKMKEFVKQVRRQSVERNFGGKNEQRKQSIEHDHGYESK